MKRFKARQACLALIMLISGVFFIAACGGGGGGDTGHWLPSNSPTVISTDPPSTADPFYIATNVCVNKLVTATFSKAMLASSITAPGTFTVKETLTGINVPGSVTYDATTRTATFTPAAILTVGLDYTATITTAAKDEEGNTLAANKVWIFTVSATVCALPPGGGPVSCLGPGPVDMGLATSFGVLVGPAAGATLTVTNPTSVAGDVGAASYVPAIGTPSPSTVIGTRYTGVDAPFVAAKADMLTAIGCASARACDFSYAAATDFATVVGLAPGVHCVTGAMSVGSNLTISTPGVYIFKSTGNLTSANTINLTLGGTANATNTSIFWVPTGSASIGTNNAFLGTIMPDASAASTLGANTTLLGGRVFSNSAVTLDTNIIAIP